MTNDIVALIEYLEKEKGIDREKVHDPELCLLMDNRTFVAHNDLGRFDVFDLDLCVVSFLEQPGCTGPGSCGTSSTRS